MRRTAPALWVLKQSKSCLPAIVIMMVSNICSALLSVAFALGTKQIIDTAVNGNKSAFSQACIKQGLIIAGIILCLLLFRYLRDRLTSKLDWIWKQKLLSGLLRGDYAQVTSYHSAEIVNRLNNDVKVVNEGILSVIPSAASTVTKLASAMIALAVLVPWFALAVALCGILLFLVTGLVRSRLKGLHKQASESDGKFSGFMQEALEKLLMVQALDVAGELDRRSDSLLQSRYRIHRKRQNLMLVGNISINFIYYAAGFLALIFCSGKILAGAMTFGTLTAVTQLVSQLQGPLADISGVIPKYIAMLAAAERLMELETLTSEDPQPISEEISDEVRNFQGICAENISFSYDRDVILQNASFKLPRGAFAVVTGPSGIGKSTILKLMLGIFKPESGSLSFECEHGQIPLDRSTRLLLSYVPQGNLLLSGTLRENLTIVSPDATEDDIAQALSVSCMEDYLPSLPQGLDTVLGESGAGLSEGQAQRLAIARAILSKAPVLLLDECTSALDADTEEKVLRRIQALQDRTCIIVTHRPAAIELCDWNLEVSNHAIISTRIHHQP